MTSSRTASSGRWGPLRTRIHGHTRGKFGRSGPQGVRSIDRLCAVSTSGLDTSEIHALNHTNMLRRPSEPAPGVWFVSPALATIIFFVAHVLLARWGDTSTESVAGLSARTPSLPLTGRVTAEIESVEPEPAPFACPVPASETDLLEQLDAHGRVVFEPAPLSRD